MTNQLLFDRDKMLTSSDRPMPKILQGFHQFYRCSTSLGNPKTCWSRMLVREHMGMGQNLWLPYDWGNNHSQAILGYHPGTRVLTHSHMFPHILFQDFLPAFRIYFSIFPGVTIYGFLVAAPWRHMDLESVARNISFSCLVNVDTVGH